METKTTTLTFSVKVPKSEKTLLHFMTTVHDFVLKIDTG